MSPARRASLCGAAKLSIARLYIVAALAFLAPAIAVGADDAPPPQGYLLAPRVFRAAVERVKPSIVTIETYGGIAKAGGKAAKKGRTPVQGISKPGEGPTTGLVISSDGYIITSTYNFITKPPIITVVLPDGSRHVATLLGRDETRGLALLKIDPPASGDALVAPEFVAASDIVVGQWAISVGVGYGGDQPAISAGIVSARNRIYGKAIQTDANTSPANYGGPLIDIEGRVIGVCVPLSPQAPGGGDASGVGVQWYDSGIGFAVPLHGADAIIERLKKGEVLQHGRMGVQPKPGFIEAGGVAIAKVADKSPAQAAGVQDNDIIIAINGEHVFDMTHLRSLLGRHLAGEKIKVTLKRGDQTVEVELSLAAGSDAPAPRQPPARVEPKKDEPKKDEPKKDEPKRDEPKQDGK